MGVGGGEGVAEVELRGVGEEGGVVAHTQERWEQVEQVAETEEEKVEEGEGGAGLGEETAEEEKVEEEGGGLEREEEGKALMEALWERGEDGSAKERRPRFFRPLFSLSFSFSSALRAERG